MDGQSLIAANTGYSSHVQNLTVSRLLGCIPEPDNENLAIHEELLPFFGLSPFQIESRRRDLVSAARSERLLTLQIKNGQIWDDPEDLGSTTRQ